MIILLRVLLTISFFTLFNKKRTPFFLLSIIIIIRFNLSGFFLSKRLSFLGLLWVLVYLGGIIVVFIYICFLFKEKENKILCHNYFFLKKNNGFLELIPFSVIILTSIYFYFRLMLKKPEASASYNSRLSLLEWEVYNSITITRLGFIILLIIIILISLINILGLLKKSFFFYQKNNII